VFADPLYSVSGDRIMRRYGVGDPDEGSASSNRLDSGAHRLPLSAKEAEVLASLVPPEFILCATGPQASRDLMNNMDLSDYDLLHCALHGNCDRRKALLSGLMLSTYTQSGAWVDGWLGTGDIRTLKLNAELVTLSCCESGLELRQAEDGVGGLVKAFMIAGARQVIATLWRVGDAATAELMTNFYKLLLGLPKTNPGEALRSAQLAVRQDQRWQDPYYWAGVILIGTTKSVRPSYRNAQF
jgi:CHAT domain-containing protein